VGIAVARVQSSVSLGRSIWRVAEEACGLEDIARVLMSSKEFPRIHGSIGSVAIP